MTPYAFAGFSDELEKVAVVNPLKAFQAMLKDRGFKKALERGYQGKSAPRAKASVVRTGRARRRSLNPDEKRQVAKAIKGGLESGSAKIMSFDDLMRR